jgi:hypothetical protein
VLAAFSADAVNPKLRFSRESFCTVSNIATGDLMEGLSSRESERWKHVRRTGLRSARAPLCTEVECLRPLLPDSPFRATIAESAQGDAMRGRATWMSPSNLTVLKSQTREGCREIA